MVDQRLSEERVGEAAAFIRGVTSVLALFAIGYGILTFLFGDPLWGSGMSHTYQAALSVPFAPESWGAICFSFGALILWAEFAEKYKLKAVACFGQGFWCFIFASFFFYDCVDQKTIFGAQAVFLYTCFGAIYFWRCRLAWKWS